MHDIGKCHSTFQHKTKNLPINIWLNENGINNRVGENDFRHEIYGKKAMVRILKNKGLDGTTSNNLSKISMLHHQGKSGKEYRPVRMEIWESIQDQVSREISTIFPFHKETFGKIGHVDGVCILLSGLMILSDWVASGDELSNIGSELENPYDYAKYCTLVAEKAREIINNFELAQSGMLANSDNIAGIFGEEFISGLRPVQAKCEEIFNDKKFAKSGLVIIEAPMGEGKTEAAMFVSAKLQHEHKKSGWYFVLPTAATGNQMFARLNKLQKAEGEESPGLLHAMAWLIDKTNDEHLNSAEDEEEMRKWLAPLRRGLLRANAVGTVDQAMMSVLLAKYSMLRLLGLSGKILILDEIHAYDSYMSDIIQNLLRWCAALDIPVVLLSATLPAKKKNEFLKAYGAQEQAQKTIYPLISTYSREQGICEHEVNESYIKRKVKLSCITAMNNNQETANIALKKIANGGCLCLIVNTVAKAQEMYKLLKENIASDNDVDLMLFHARFLAKRRNEIEKLCMDKYGKYSLLDKKDSRYKPRPKKAILVATQVVEQSLDVDFDFIISELAPIDLLLQRMGRQFRHEGRLRPTKEPEFTVLIPKKPRDYGVSKEIYSEWILYKTQEILTKTEYAYIPNSIRNLVEYVYNVLPNHDNFDENSMYMEFIAEDLIKKSSASGIEISSPKEDSFCFAEMGSILNLSNDSEENVLKAKTRLSMPTGRIAFVDEESFEELKNMAKPSKKMAKHVMLNSVAIQENKLAIVPDSGYFAPIKGEGLLKWIYVFCAPNGIFKVNDTKILGYEVCNEMGLIIQTKE